MIRFSCTYDLRIRFFCLVFISTCSKPCICFVDEKTLVLLDGRSSAFMSLESQVFLILQEKKAAELAPSTNSIRWNLGHSGSVVSFSEDVGLPSFFSTGPCRLVHTFTFLLFCMWHGFHLSCLKVSFTFFISGGLTSNVEILFLDIHHHEKSVLLRHAPTRTSIVMANPMFLSAVFNVTK